MWSHSSKHFAMSFNTWLFRWSILGISTHALNTNQLRTNSIQDPNVEPATFASKPQMERIYNIVFLFQKCLVFDRPWKNASISKNRLKRNMLSRTSHQQVPKKSVCVTHPGPLGCCWGLQIPSGTPCSLRPPGPWVSAAWPASSFGIRPLGGSVVSSFLENHGSICG